MSAPTRRALLAGTPVAALILGAAAPSASPHSDAALHQACEAYWMAWKAERDGVAQCEKDGEDLDPVLTDAIDAATRAVGETPALTSEGMRAKAKVLHHLMMRRAGFPVPGWRGDNDANTLFAIDAVREFAGEALS